MSVDIGGFSGWWEVLAGLVFSTLAGAFGYTQKRISDLETELRADQVAEVNAVRAELLKVETSLNARLLEERTDRGEMWRTIREMQTQNAGQHSENLEKISKLPTRDEMLRMMEQLTARSGRTTPRQ